MKEQKKSRIYAGTFRVFCNFAKQALIPQEGFERSYFERCTPFTDEDFVTLDGVKCKILFVMTWSEALEGSMDELCMEKWGCRFKQVRSMWIDRLNYVGKTWHLIKMEKI